MFKFSQFLLNIYTFFNYPCLHSLFLSKLCFLLYQYYCVFVQNFGAMNYLSMQYSLHERQAHLIWAYALFAITDLHADSVLICVNENHLKNGSPERPASGWKLNGIMGDACGLFVVTGPPGMGRKHSRW